MVYAVDDVDQLCSSSQDVTLREYATAYDAVQNGDFEESFDLDENSQQTNATVPPASAETPPRSDDEDDDEMSSDDEPHPDKQMAFGFNCQVTFASIVVAFVSSFVFGWNQGVLNQPQPFIKSFFNQSISQRYTDGAYPDSLQLTSIWSALNSIYVVGLFFGCLTGGSVANKLGRKGTILFSQIFLVIGIGLVTSCVVCNSVEMFFVGRILIGFMCGMICAVTPMYLAEVSTPRIRGALMTGHQLFVTFGILLTSVFGLPQLLSTEPHWPYLQLLNGVPALFAIICLPFIPETPRYLLLVVGDPVKAKKSLIWYRGSENVDDEMTELEEEKKRIQVASQTPFTVKELFGKKLRRPFFIAMFLQVVQQFSGVNAIFFYSFSIYTTAGVSSSNIPFAIVGTNALNFAMTIVALGLMDAAGRRVLLIYPMAIMIADLILLTVMMAIHTSYPWANYVSIVCVLLYVVTFAIGLGPIPWMVGSELFRERPRPLAMAACGMMNFVGTFIIVLAFEPLEHLIGCYVFLIFVVLLVGFLIFVIICVPETRNKTFDEIAKELNIAVEDEY